MDDLQKTDARKRILLIDDDEEILKSLTSLLELEGYKVTSYPNGRNIEKKIKDAKPDLLIIDYMLPDKNGAEISLFLRNIQKIRKLPIVMISANRLHRKAAQEAGVSKFLDKPFDLYKFLSVVKKYT